MPPYDSQELHKHSTLHPRQYPFRENSLSEAWHWIQRRCLCRVRPVPCIHILPYEPIREVLFCRMFFCSGMWLLRLACLFHKLHSVLHRKSDVRILLLRNELPEGKLFNFSRFSIKEGSWLRQHKGLTWKSWFIEMLMMVLAAGGCLLSNWPALLSSTAHLSQGSGYYKSEEQKMRPWKLHISFIIIFCKIKMGLPWWLSGKESTSQCRRNGFNLWVRKIHWRKKWQPSRAVWEIPWIEESWP